MTFEEFGAYIEERILEGWMEDAEAVVRTVWKNNGVKLLGLYIRSEEESVSPAIYLEDYYDCFLKGESMEAILLRIREEYGRISARLPVCHVNLDRFDCVRDWIIYRLVNYEKNKEILEDCPHLRLYDLALTFRWVAHSDEIGISTALITNQELALWKTSVSELLLAAKANTKRLFPARILEMGEMLREAGLQESLAWQWEIPMYVMTNRQEINGASVLFYDDILKNFAREKASDFYILPSSIHEVILIPAGEIDNPDALFGMVRDANETVVSLGDILSDSVYFYERESNRMKPLFPARA